MTDKFLSDIMAEITAKEKSFMESVKPGDIAFASKDESFSITGFRFFTAGKGYKVLATSKTCDSIRCETDLIGEHQFLNSFSISYVTRDGLIIWDSRTKVKFNYKKEFAKENQVDAYGFHVYETKVYYGFLVNSAVIDVSDCNAEHQFRYVVELMSEFRGGKKGDLVTLGSDYMEVTYLGDSL